MPLSTFSPALAPSIGSEYSVSPRVRLLRFGDGYEQRTADGLNHIARSYALSWARLSKDQADAIEDFFRQRGGVEAFWYMPPGETVSMKFRASQWRRRNLEGGRVTLTAQFEQVFDLS